MGERLNRNFRTGRLINFRLWLSILVRQGFWYGVYLWVIGLFLKWLCLLLTHKVLSLPNKRVFIFRTNSDCLFNCDLARVPFVWIKNTQILILVVKWNLANTDLIRLLNRLWIILGLLGFKLQVLDIVWSLLRSIYLNLILNFLTNLRSILVLFRSLVLLKLKGRNFICHRAILLWWLCCRYCSFLFLIPKVRLYIIRNASLQIVFRKGSLFQLMRLLINFLIY